MAEATKTQTYHSVTVMMISPTPIEIQASLLGLVNGEEMVIPVIQNEGVTLDQIQASHQKLSENLVKAVAEDRSNSSKDTND